MKIEYDNAKNAINIKKHGIAFDAVHDMDQSTSFTVEDSRHNYGEQRFITMGFIHERLHILVWSPRGENIRIISLRKANETERMIYDEI